LIAACAIASFANTFFRGQFVAVVVDGHGVHHFSGLAGGGAGDILRGDLEGVEEQAGMACVKAGTEKRSHDLGERYLDGGGVFQHRELDVVPCGAFRFGHGVRTGVEITK
jgi:hypothetical protein